MKNLKEFLKSIFFLAGTFIVSFLVVLVLAILAETVYSKLVPTYDERGNPFFMYLKIFFGPFVSVLMGGAVQGSKFKLGVYRFLWPLVFISIIFWAIGFSGMFSDGTLVFFFGWLILVIAPWTMGYFFGAWWTKKRGET